MDTAYFEQYPESELDLHGLTRDQALSELDEFVRWARSSDLHYIRVITGKGSGSFDNVPVVRNAVIAYLNMNNYHYRFANMFDGGEGVLYVEL